MNGEDKTNEPIVSHMAAPEPKPKAPEHHNSEVEEEFLEQIMKAEALAVARGASYATLYGHLKLRCALLEKYLLEGAEEEEESEEYGDIDGPDLGRL